MSNDAAHPLRLAWQRLAAAPRGSAERYARRLELLEALAAHDDAQARTRRAERAAHPDDDTLEAFQ